MLRGLNIRNMLLIERLDLDFQPGLNVLTGETGAGKSILLDSLGFVLGWRGRADLVRKGADQGEVTASFDIGKDHPVQAVLENAGLADAGELILRRINKGDGRKQAFVNDRRCSGDILRQISEHLVELHGQHDDRGLLNAKGHKALLDGFAGHLDLLGKTRKAWAEVATAQGALSAAQLAHEAAAKDQEFLRHAVAELEDLGAEPGEDALLDGQRRLMQASARIGEDIAKAAEILGPQAAEGRLLDAMGWLQGVEESADGQLGAPIEALNQSLGYLADAQAGVQACLEALHFSPHALENTEERLFAIRAMARKHGVSPDGLAAFATQSQARLQTIDGGEDRLAGLEADLRKAEAYYQRLAGDLQKKRQDAARRLDLAMAAELAPLKMERAVFTTNITACAPGPDGADLVQFTVATNPGAPSGPIHKIASGGELSRFLLALKVCLTARSEGLTMIFDEIDRGVGGATADAVGRRLAALADNGQVLVVTHSPQVAALGGHHWLVEKSTTTTKTTTMVRPILGEARRDEVARMLAGDTITAEARAAAQVLLKA